MNKTKIHFETDGNSSRAELHIALRLPVTNLGGNVIKLQYGQLPNGSWIARATPLMLGAEVRVVDGLTTKEQAEACALECGRKVVEQVKGLWVSLKKNGESDEVIRAAKVTGRDVKGFQVTL